MEIIETGNVEEHSIPELEQFWHGKLKQKDLQQKKEFCIQFINSVCSTIENEKQKHMVTSYAKMELGTLLEQIDQDDEAEQALSESLELAYLSTDPQTIYRALHYIGMHNFHNGDYEVAATNFQSAMRYANGIWPYNLLNGFDWLGRCWSKTDKTLLQAVWIYEWLSYIHPTPLEALIGKYECMLRLGQREMVIQDASPKQHATLLSLVSAIAACIALGRKKKARCLILEAIEFAERTNEKQWVKIFESHITTI